MNMEKSGTFHCVKSMARGEMEDIADIYSQNTADAVAKLVYEWYW